MQKLVALQGLRVMAALWVAILHAQHEAGLLAGRDGSFAPFGVLPWDAGVDIFFVVSGFVMVQASGQLFGRATSWREFMSRRLARVAPLYWLTTACFLAVALSAPGLVNASPTALGHTIASFLFVPIRRADGLVQPVYSLGWTLNYEMAFYLLFALSLALSRRSAVALVTATLFCVVAAGRLTNDLPDALAFWSNPIILEFALGMGLGLARAEGVAFGPATRAAFALAGLALFAIAAFDQADLLRPLFFGVPAACLVAAAGLGQPRGGAAERPRDRLVVLLGDASYALYLIHPFVIRGWREALRFAGSDTLVSGWLFISTGLLAAVLASIVVHLTIERPMTTGAQTLLAVRSRRTPRVGVI